MYNLPTLPCCCPDQDDCKVVRFGPSASGVGGLQGWNCGFPLSRERRVGADSTMWKDFAIVLHFSWTETGAHICAPLQFGGYGPVAFLIGWSFTIDVGAVGKPSGLRRIDGCITYLHCRAAALTRTIAKLFKTRRSGRQPRGWEDSKVGTVDSRFRGKDGLGQIPPCGKDFAAAPYHTSHVKLRLTCHLSELCNRPAALVGRLRVWAGNATIPCAVSSVPIRNVPQ